MWVGERKESGSGWVCMCVCVCVCVRVRMNWLVLLLRSGTSICSLFAWASSCTPSSLLNFFFIT